MATFKEISEFVQKSREFILDRELMKENNKGGRIFRSAADELDELTKAFENAGWNPEHPEEFDIFKHATITEELADPILYVLQALHGTDIQIEYYLQDLLETHVTYKDVEILIQQAKEDATDPESAKFSELTKAYRVLGSMVLFCLAHGVDPIKVSAVKNAYNEVRFDPKKIAEGMTFTMWIAECKRMERELKLKKELYPYLTKENIGFSKPDRQTNAAPLGPVLIAMQSHMQSLELAVATAA